MFQPFHGAMAIVASGSFGESDEIVIRNSTVKRFLFAFVEKVMKEVFVGSYFLAATSA
jgi:hypothetical protein